MKDGGASEPQRAVDLDDEIARHPAWGKLRKGLDGISKLCDKCLYVTLAKIDVCLMCGEPFK